MFLKFFLAILPILWLIIALSVLKIAGHKACLIALVITAVLAAGYWKLSLVCTATAGLEGVLNALWPICLVIVAALFTYNLTLETGAMELIKKMLASVSVDQRVLLLIIGWGFGNFMEGMAGFGTAVAIPASMLAAIGINPILSVIACLVVNSTPTAFGSVGVPTVTLASVTNLDALQLSGNVALIQGNSYILVTVLYGIYRWKGIQSNKECIANDFNCFSFIYCTMVYCCSGNWM
ncbi:MAG: L-lactate permease [Anaerobutyricum sp.]